MYKKFLKRTMDIVLSIVGILVLALPMLIIAVIVRIDSPGPAFFRQRRVGKYGKEFLMLKFRTMKTSAPHDMPTDKLVGAGQLVTCVGHFLRRSSLDELPQLFNILCGHMSIIGPRPALPSQTELLARREQNGAAALRPGLSGWAQINGRDMLDDAKKAELDGEYAEKVSFAFDVKCFFGTIKCVLRADGFCDER